MWMSRLGPPPLVVCNPADERKLCVQRVVQPYVSGAEFGAVPLGHSYRPRDLMVKDSLESSSTFLKKLGLPLRVILYAYLDRRAVRQMRTILQHDHVILDSALEAFHGLLSFGPHDLHFIKTRSPL